MEATARIVHVAPNTVAKFLVDLGKACTRYQARVFENIFCKRIQCDEIWSFVGCKEKNVTNNGKRQGDTWTWIACDPDTKLVPCWFIGRRDSESAKKFMRRLARHLSLGSTQITTDGLKAYINAIKEILWIETSYGMVEKKYDVSGDDHRTRYIGSEKTAIFGNPDPDTMNTSIVERQNLTMRMSMRRFTRKTNGYSKKIANHRYAIALHFMYYNFARIHSTLNTTPAVAAGIANHVWSLDKILKLIER